MMKSATSLILCAGIAMTTGCASIVSKSQYPVTINSNPSGASVTVKNKQGVDVQRATTPATVMLAAKAGFFSPASYSFQFEKDGYFPASTSLSAGMDGWYVGNFLFGGLIGVLIVDPATGAMWRLDDTVCGNLSPDPNAEAEPTPAAPAAAPSPDSQTRQPRLEREPATDIQEEAAQTPIDPTVVAKKQQLRQLLSEGRISEQEFHDLMKEVVDE